MARLTPSRNPAGYSGLRENLLAFFGSLAQFFQSRFELAARDSKAAIGRFMIAIAGAVVAAVLSLFGYVFLLVFAVVGIAHLLGIWWIWTALAAAVINFVVALFCVFLARAQLKGPFFHDTRSVLQEDSQWLKNLDHSTTR